MIDRRIAAYQSDIIKVHCDEVRNSYSQMRAWRHAYHNHIQTLLALADDPENIRAYLLKLDSDLKSVDTVIKTGNVMVDAILNSKLSLIKSKEIAVNAKASVPEKLAVSETDLCIIIGNLLDNAMEACSLFPLPQESFIRIYIGTFKQQLYISVTNSVYGTPNKKGNYPSSKAEGNHGFGLLQIDRLTEKYGGYVNRQSEPGVFATEIMLPLTVHA
ncbi:MAG: sensor histidine kinase [Clostridia bacterium]|nr:sensor histidine kinase [Clostridia bacterium]